MPEFLELIPPNEALSRWLENIPVCDYAPDIIETIPTRSALGRITAQPILAPIPLPSFSRSTVDGYAVRSQDTYGAGETLPAYLMVIGEVLMGTSSALTLQAEQCAVIHTGGMLPPGSDAVVMIEHTQSLPGHEVEILKAAAPGENVLHTGEDVAAGQEVIPQGARLRPAEIGGLMALGITQVSVVKRPTVAILSSGDEIIHPELETQPGQVRDVNSYSLSALVEQAGGQPLLSGIVKDSEDELYQRARQALTQSDMLVITAGSSASARDLTAQIVDRLGKPGVLVHGVNVRPGKPTILAVCDGKPVIGLPGNPVSALVIAMIFVRPAIEHLSGQTKKPFWARLHAPINLNIPSQAGREDWVPVRLAHTDQGLEASPIFSKSNLIFSLARADGLVRIPPDANGISAGEMVEIYLL